jgi:serine/threonine protein kinase
MTDPAPRRYELVRDEQGVLKPPLGTPGSQGGVFLGRSNADPPEEVAMKILFVDERSSAATEAVLRPPSALRMRRRTASQADYPARARQDMFVAANVGGGHPHILGLVADAYPLIKLSERPDKRRDGEKCCTNCDGEVKWYSYDAIVMPIARGGDIIDYAGSGAPMHRATARAFFLQMVAGTVHLHMLGIAHLDLKLENMFLDRKDARARLMISDFGMAMPVPPTGAANAGRLNCRFKRGDPRFAPPETTLHDDPGFAVHGDNTDGFAVDMWALGVCLSNLLLGFGTFNDKEHTKSKQDLFTEMRAAQLADENGLRKVCSMSVRGRSAVKRFNAFPPELQSLLNGMLWVNPAQRFKISDVAAHPWVAAGAGTPAPAPAPMGAPTTRARSEFRSLAAAADEAEVPRYNACSALPDSAASGGGEGDDEDLEAVIPQLGRGTHVLVL